MEHMIVMARKQSACMMSVMVIIMSHVVMIIITMSIMGNNQNSLSW